ncbi:MAG: hypothetical protein L0Z53_13610, partial [Acidobacteriales bacterium]|nr:hypothetical protein [Terriglobales bacterium]
MANSYPHRAQRLLSTHQPMLYAAVAFAAGILMASRVWRPATWWIAASLIFVLGTILFISRRHSVSFVFGLLAMVGLGALNFQLREHPG